MQAPQLLHLKCGVQEASVFRPATQTCVGGADLPVMVDRGEESRNLMPSEVAQVTPPLTPGARTMICLAFPPTSPPPSANAWRRCSASPPHACNPESRLFLLSHLTQ